MGSKGGSVGKYIGRNGRCYANPKKRAAWVLNIYACSMRPCSQNKCGGWFMISIHYFIKCVKRNIFFMGPFFMLLYLRGLMLSKAF